MHHNDSINIFIAAARYEILPSHKSHTYEIYIHKKKKKNHRNDDNKKKEKILYLYQT